MVLEGGIVDQHSLLSERRDPITDDFLSIGCGRANGLPKFPERRAHVGRDVRKVLVHASPSAHDDPRQRPGRMKFVSMLGAPRARVDRGSTQGHLSSKAQLDKPGRFRWNQVSLVVD